MRIQRAWLLVMVLGLVAATVPTAWAEDAVVEPPAEPDAPDGKDWSVELDLTYNSHYIWRGINFTDDPVFQPSITFAWKGLSLNVWGSMDLTNVNGNNDEFNEVDFTLDYSAEAVPISYSIGFIRYHFPNTPFPGTSEVYCTVGIDAPLSPSVTVYYDCDEADGVYATCGLSHTFENIFTVSENVSVNCDLSAAVAYADDDYNAFYFGVADSAFVDAVASIGFPIALGDHVTVTPAANYSNLLDDKLAAAAGKQSNWWTGISVTFAF